MYIAIDATVTITYKYVELLIYNALAIIFCVQLFLFSVFFFLFAFLQSYISLIREYFFYM